MFLAVLATTVANAYVTVGEPIKVSWVYGDFSHWVNDVSWSPDGEHLAIGVGKSLIILNKDGTLNWSKDRLGVSQFDDVRSVAWSPDGGS